MNSGDYWQWHRLDRKSQWPRLSEAQFRTVIWRAAMRERTKVGPARFRYRRARLEAVRTYVRRFGDADFLRRFECHRMPGAPKSQPNWKGRLSERRAT